MADEDAPVRQGRRRRANHAGGRGRVIQVRVSEAEDRVLRASAERAGMTVQRLLVESVLRRESGEDIASRHAASGELIRLVRAVSSVGVNVNQMAKATNATGELPENMAATVEGIRDLVRRANVAIDRVGMR